MSTPIFVDTTVFVAARQTNDPVKQSRAARWIEQLWNTRQGRTSVQVMSEYYFALVQRIRPPLPSDEAWSAVCPLLAWNPLPLDGRLLHRAHEIEISYRLNWGDSLTVAAAQLQNCGLLLTYQLPDGTRFGNVAIRNPSTLGVAEPAAVYGSWTANTQWLHRAPIAAAVS